MKNAHIFSINYSDLNSVSNNLHCKLIKQNLIVRVDVHRKFYMNVKWDLFAVFTFDPKFAQQSCKKKTKNNVSNDLKAVT